jgi:hypothetical protein
MEMDLELYIAPSCEYIRATRSPRQTRGHLSLTGPTFGCTVMCAT